MNKQKVLAYALLVAIIFVGYWTFHLLTSKKSFAVKDPLNATYIIEGREYTLKDGKLEKEIIPGSASKIKIDIFDYSAKGDINNDGTEDTAVLLSYDPGGSGTFFYIASAIKNGKKYKGTNAILIGDRITPQTVKVEDGKIIVNYKERSINDSMASQPSVNITREFSINGYQLKEVTSESQKKEYACLVSGGTVDTSSCCGETADFPNSCLAEISSDSSQETKICDCGPEKCFDGQRCVSLTSKN